mmetsp:Transcript_74025/g.228777  ORF Transcript_74025/g.228777 Transcript_74025/m.228777 type:complete len:254 (+) Transcript_74025:302-1063(+)
MTRAGSADGCLEGHAVEAETHQRVLVRPVESAADVSDVVRGRVRREQRPVHLLLRGQFARLDLRFRGNSSQRLARLRRNQSLRWLNDEIAGRDPNPLELPLVCDLAVTPGDRELAHGHAVPQSSPRLQATVRERRDRAVRRIHVPQALLDKKSMPLLIRSLCCCLGAGLVARLQAVLRDLHAGRLRDRGRWLLGLGRTRRFHEGLLHIGELGGAELPRTSPVCSDHAQLAQQAVHGIQRGPGSEVARPSALSN